MKRRGRTILLSSMLVIQFITAGATSLTHAAQPITAEHDQGMCGGGGGNLLESEAYRNALKAYALTVANPPQKSASMLDDRKAWGAVWK